MVRRPALFLPPPLALRALAAMGAAGAVAGELVYFNVEKSDMSENEFWLRVWQYGVIGFCVLIISGASCTMNRQYQIRALIENAKIDPIAAKCALEPNNLREAPCVLQAIKQPAD